MRPRLLKPTSTAAVVLGAHDWTEAGLGRAPSFRRSARRVVAYLYDPAGLGLDSELVLDLFDDPAGAGDQLARVRDTLDMLLRERLEAGRPVTDVLVYYVGHGHTDDQGHLSLLVRRSRRGLEVETGIKAPDLARTLRLAAPQQRQSVILDCCFSEAAAKAFIGMAGDLNQQVAATAAKDLRDDQPARGTLLLCSSPVGQVSMGAPNAERTLFTGAVLEVLQQGVQGRPPYLSFAELRDAAFDRMVVSFGANAPRPALHQVNATQGDLTRAPAFPNRAAASERSESEQQGRDLGTRTTSPEPTAAKPGEAILRDLVERGRVAHLIPEIRTWSIDKSRLITLNMSVLNAGSAPAIKPWVSLFAEDVEEHQWFSTLLPGERTTITMAGRLSESEFKKRNPVLLIQFTSATPDGHLICDDTNVELAWKIVGEQTEIVMCDYSCKRYIDSSAIKLKDGEFDQGESDSMASMMSLRRGTGEALAIRTLAEPMLRFAPAAPDASCAAS